MKPPLTWVGGKRWHAPAVEVLWRANGAGVIVEPFCGGGAITFLTEARFAWLNDVNPHLINFYRQWLSGALDGTQLTTDKTVYYGYRDWFNDLVASGMGDTAIAAELFYYLNYFGFNALWRVNAKGQFNVPPRPGARGPLPPIPAIPRFTADFRHRIRYKLTCGDFANVALAPDDFVYADPPYDAGFTHYTAAGFTWADQVRLATHLAGHPGPVVLMNKATPRVLELYRDHGFTVNPIAGRQAMHRSRTRTDDVLEVIATLNVVIPSS